MRRVIRAVVTFHRDVRIDAAESGGAHCCAMAAAGTPVAAADELIQVRTGLEELIRYREPHRGGLYPVIDRQRGFDEAGNASGRLGMSDDRFDRADAAAMARIGTVPLLGVD